jgi:DNA-binding NtrC family response regulator/pSer/pThr/pTyr-binding forkhead associated (FHA) protein
MPDRNSQHEKVFRLHGELQGQARVFVLGPGDNRVGADPANPIHIPVRQVSRRHAVLRVNGDGVKLEDLGSTNGTFVNGVRVRKARLGENDWVQFGPVVLTFESLSADEHALAISLDDPEASGPEEPIDQARTTEIGIRPRSRIQWGETLALCASRLINRWHPDVIDSVNQLSAAMDGASVIFLVPGESGTASVQAAAGDLALFDWQERQDELVSLRPNDPDWNGFSCGVLSSRPPVTAAVSWTNARWDSALVVAGIELGIAERPFLEVALRMLQSATVPIPENGRSQAVAADFDLRFPDWHVVGRSPAMVALYRQLATFLRGSVPLLVTGETGAGKEHVLRILHASSDRAGGPLQIVNCTAIPPDLLEAELFGIEAGVATGVTRRRGKLRLANGGILFLDEIGDMAPALQAKLLRALQEGEVQPLGAAAPVTVDVRVVAATNTDLEQRVRDGLFRKDLYYRIAGCEIKVPPLRRRREDIPALARYFLERAAKESCKPVRGLSVTALEALQNAAWPGNIRQLQRELTRLVAVCPPGHTIESSMIAPTVLTESVPDEAEHATDDLELKRHLEALEKRLIERAIDRAAGNRSEAARLLGITRNGLSMKIRRLRIEQRSEHR